MAGIKPKSWHGSKSAVENARLNLPKLTRQYFRLGRKAFRREPNELHRFRLDTKRYRYTLELFIPIYGPGLKSRLESLKKIQNYLGDLSDCGSAVNLLRADANDADAGTRKEVKKIIRSLKKRARKKADEFHEHWRTVFDAPGEEKRWIEYLARFAGRKAQGRGR